MASKKSNNRTVQTVQSGNWFEVALDSDGRWQWMLWAANGRRIARSGITFQRRRDCVAAIRQLARNLAEASQVVQMHEGEVMADPASGEEPPLDATQE